MFEHSQEQSSPKTSTSTKVRHELRHSLNGFLSVSQAAKMLGVNSVTVTRWCEQGHLPAKNKAFGKRVTYEILPKAIELFLKDRKPKDPQQIILESKPHSAYIKGWKQAMEKGLMTGKVFSPSTVSYYIEFTEGFLENQKVLNAQTFKTELMKVPAAQFSKRFKLYKALVSFAKYLIQAGQLEEAFLQEVKHLYPKRHKPPVRKTVTEEQLQQLISVCKRPSERLIVLLLANTGLRASEACSLKLEDLDLEQGVIMVQLGKGGKKRGLGFGKVLKATLQAYLRERQTHARISNLLLSQDGHAMNRYGLAKRLERLGKKADVTVSPHALRRAFVTINANKGRPLVILQRSCGHSDIKTTMSYCMTAEQEVIEAMKGWD